MNQTTYIFGRLNGNYSQLPDDYTQAFLPRFYEKASPTQTQMAVHRDGNLMYYGYVRRLEDGDYLGFCVLLNDVLITDIKGAFDAFEQTFADMPTKGDILQFSKEGTVVANTAMKSLADRSKAAKEIEDLLGVRFQRLSGSIQKLPAQSFSVASEEVQRFRISDQEDDIIRSFHTNGFTYIYKDEDYDTASLHSYQGVIKGLNEENESLKKKLSEQRWAKFKEKLPYIIGGLIALGLLLGLVLNGVSSCRDKRQIKDIQLFSAHFLEAWERGDQAAVKQAYPAATLYGTHGLNGISTPIWPENVRVAQTYESDNRYMASVSSGSDSITLYIEKGADGLRILQSRGLYMFPHDELELARNKNLCSKETNDIEVAGVLASDAFARVAAIDKRYHDSLRAVWAQEEAEREAANRRKEAIKEAYQTILSQYENKPGVAKYFLHDITGDDVPELWVTTARDAYGGVGEQLEYDPLCVYRTSVYTANGSSARMLSSWYHEDVGSEEPMKYLDGGDFLVETYCLDEDCVAGGRIVSYSGGAIRRSDVNFNSYDDLGKYTTLSEISQTDVSSGYGLSF